MRPFTRILSNSDYHIVHNKSVNTSNPAIVSVITPVYNAEKYLRKTIESVIHQSLGFYQIQYILIDDKSTDSSREILREYSSKFENIIVIFLKKNTGTPAIPRNIGIELSSSKYITFLDADDWLELTGLEVLINILEETGSDYAVGKTIQVQTKGTRIVGEHESCKERRNVSPYSIPHIFHHLGPRARIVKANVIKNNRIQFPEMRFAEDKQFFIDVLTSCHKISTTQNPIYYLNRLNNQSTRLSNQTNIIQKSKCNLKVIKHVMKKNLDVQKEKMILNRLYEFDQIERFFTTPHFQRTKLKFLYYLIFNRVIKTTRKLRYEFSQEFLNPFNKTSYQLFLEGKYKELEKLYDWDMQNKIKDVVIQNNLPYIEVPFLEGKYKYIRLHLHAVAKESYIQQNKYSLKFLVFGEYVHSITDIIVRDNRNAFYEKSLPIIVDQKGNGTLEFGLDILDTLPPATYSIYLRYNDYLKINIRGNSLHKLNFKYNNRNVCFYNTIYSNIGFKISNC